MVTAAAPSTPSRARHHCSAHSALVAQQGQGSLTDLAAPQLFPGTWGGQLWGTVSVWLHPSVPGLRTGRFVQSQEMAVLPKVRVCETDTFFFSFSFFSLYWGVSFTPFSLLTPHFPWARSKNNPGAILSHQRHKELLLPAHWLLRIQRS